MTQQTNNPSQSIEEDTGSSHRHGSQDANSASAAASKLPHAWDSPTFEAFDLCMEVTAYVQQWEQL